MRIEELNAETVQQYRLEIAQFYYDNVRSNTFHSHYTYDEAYEKIGELMDHLSVNEAIVYGVFNDKEIVGFIWAYVHQFREETRMYVSEIRVKEEYQHRGIGSRLLKLVENRAKEKKIGAIYLHAEARNLKARKFYNTCGYKEERIQLRKNLL